MINISGKKISDFKNTDIITNDAIIPIVQQRDNYNIRVRDFIDIIREGIISGGSSNIKYPTEELGKPTSLFVYVDKHNNMMYNGEFEGNWIIKVKGKEEDSTINHLGTVYILLKNNDSQNRKVIFNEVFNYANVQLFPKDLTEIEVAPNNYLELAIKGYINDNDGTQWFAITHLNSEDTSKPSINIVQTTGSSTVDVMSQAAVTNALNNKLDKGTVEIGAQKNVQSDWNVTSTTSDAFIKNKPTIPDTSKLLIKNSQVNQGDVSINLEESFLVEFEMIPYSFGINESQGVEFRVKNGKSILVNDENLMITPKFENILDYDTEDKIYINFDPLRDTTGYVELNDMNKTYNLVYIDNNPFNNELLTEASVFLINTSSTSSLNILFPSGSEFYINYRDSIEIPAKCSVELIVKRYGKYHVLTLIPFGFDLN